MKLPTVLGGLFLAAALAGCGATKASDEDALVETLVTAHLLEVRQHELGDVPDAVRDSALAFHGFTPAEFRLRMDALIENPAQAESVYVRVERRLEVLRSHTPSADSLST